ncbi:hypothetical protein P691DRAFT_629169, partial [Macrolepiota fuliginosa MF-IS2]
PPSSSFAGLLRRSRFASYDPAIAQTYTAPPASARRGNYGLKRPIPMPYKDSYIAVNTFEHHAHFAEWNNAEEQVHLVKRVEEMGIHPRQLPSSSWDKGLGEARTQWLIDSEFAEYESAPASTPAAEVESPRRDNLDAYGKQGRGGYGAKRPPPKTSVPEPEPSNTQINVESMSPHQFQRYLDKIRSLGPEFRAYLFEQQRERLTTQLHELLLYIASQNSSQKLHRHFLSKHSASSHTSPTSHKIAGQPHRTGGLTYTHTSPLNSVLTTPPQPGTVLQIEPKSSARFSQTNYQNNAQDYVALLGGIIAKLPSRNSGIKVPIYNPEAEAAVTGSAPTNAGDPENSFASMRMTRLTLRNPPKVVGYAAHKMRPGEIVKGIKFDGECMTEVPWSQRNLGNPYRPGSYEYSA